MTTRAGAISADGPCWACRRPMNWIAADRDCLPFCRWCLLYLLEASRWAPTYASLLCRKANEHARRRWDRQIDFSGWPR